MDQKVEELEQKVKDLEQKFKELEQKFNQKVNCIIKKDYGRRDSNPGHVDGNDISYPWTTPVFPIVNHHILLLTIDNFLQRGAT